uniref:Uncharacterized protein n=1 Tax=Balaenoptera musculus TaxID=9771 RepID=A0A8C0CDH8_BALMU
LEIKESIGPIIHTRNNGLNTFRYRENYNRGYFHLLKRDLGARPQNGVYGITNYISTESHFVSVGIQTSFRTGNTTGTDQNCLGFRRRCSKYAIYNILQAEIYWVSC